MKQAENQENSIVDSFTYECGKQSRLKEQMEAEGLSCIDDPAGLYDLIGTVQEIETLCELYTPKFLAKLYGKDLVDQPQSFWLVPLWQILKYNYIIPQPGEIFKAKYVVGVRRILSNGFVPSLRLPLN